MMITTGKLPVIMVDRAGHRRPVPSGAGLGAKP